VAEWKTEPGFDSHHPFLETARAGMVDLQVWQDGGIWMWSIEITDGDSAGGVPAGCGYRESVGLAKSAALAAAEDIARRILADVGEAREKA
jgi:hypothetical protein